MVTSVAVNGVDSPKCAAYFPGFTTPAQVAELVDALASGASVRMDVEVRVLSWAPYSPKLMKFEADLCD